MLRRDFLRRMAFAAIASGVLGRMSVAEPVEWIEDGATAYANFAAPQPMTVYVRWTEVDGLEVEHVEVSEHGARVDVPGPTHLGIRPGVYVADGVRSLAEMRSLARV